MSNARAWDKENSLKLVFTKYNAVREYIHQLQLSACRKLNVYKIRISAERKNMFQ